MLTKKQLQDAANCEVLKCKTCSMDSVCYETVFSGTNALAQTALAYRVMLERLEWVDNDYCPICGQYKANGHANDCELAALLKESEVEK